MSRRSIQLIKVGGVIIVTIVALLLVANVRPIDRACSWQFPKLVSCLLSGREVLAAGLIGTGGAVFAGWLAYSAAIESSERALREAGKAQRVALDGRIADYRADIDRLRLGLGYLKNFAANFPPTNAGSAATGFANVFRKVHSKALDVVSTSAIGAPFGYGPQIATVMERMKTLGQRMEDAIDRQPAISPDAWSQQIFDMIHGIRALAEQIADDIPIHDRYLVRLINERDALPRG